MNSSVGRMGEVMDELRTVVLGRTQAIDALLPPVVFLAANSLAGGQAAALAAALVSAGLAIVRVARRQSALPALVGLGGALLALLLARGSARAETYFVPDLILQATLALVSAVSIALGRPMAAWTSQVVRRWPRAWYAHPRVRPAYVLVTSIWILYFALQAVVQGVILQRQDPGWMAVSNLVGSWPGTIALLLVSYLVGTRRLQTLGGPSVEEFVRGSPPPWTGQRRGF